MLTQLPDKTRQYLTVDITTTKEYKAAEADMVKYLKKYKNASDEQVQKINEWCRYGADAAFKADICQR